MVVCEDKDDPIILIKCKEGYFIERLGETCRLRKRYKEGQIITIMELIEWYYAGHCIIQRLPRD